MSNKKLTRADLIEKKEKQLQKNHTRILQLSDEITSKASNLRQLRVSEKSVRVANIRLSTRASTCANDVLKRPSDRDKEIKILGRQDNDLWKMADVRQWYQKNAPSEDIKFVETPVDTGYMIRMDHAEK